jgi:hypothetical protein
MIFALGLLLVEPIGCWFARSATHGSVPWNTRRRDHRWIGIGAEIPTVGLQALIVVVDCALVLYVCRVAGFSERYPGDSAVPMVLLLPAVAGGIFFGVLVGLSPRFRYRSLRLDSRGGARPRRRAKSVGSRPAHRAGPGSSVGLNETGAHVRWSPEGGTPLRAVDGRK